MLTEGEAPWWCVLTSPHVMKCGEGGMRQRSLGNMGWEDEVLACWGPNLPGSFRPPTPLTDAYQVLLLCRGSLPGWSQAMLASVETVLITGSTGRQPVLSATASASGITPSPVGAMAGSSSLTVSMPCARHCPRHRNPGPGEPACPCFLPPRYPFIHLAILIKHLLQARQSLTRPWGYSTEPEDSRREHRRLTSNYLQLCPGLL